MTEGNPRQDLAMVRCLYMNNDKKLDITCRAVILYEGKLLLVRHPHDTSFAALPGGHLEYGEGLKECQKREVMEELGIEPDMGRLLYVNNFTQGDIRQSVEFFFEIKNSAQYAETKKLTGTHTHELAELVWASPDDDIKILPKKLEIDFKRRDILFDEPRFIIG